jgi:hypothetical protein
MEEDVIPGKTEECIEEIISMIKSMEKECTDGQMVEYTLANGTSGNKMTLEFTYCLMEKSRKPFGLMERKDLILKWMSGKKRSVSDLKKKPKELPLILSLNSEILKLKLNRDSQYRMFNKSDTKRKDYLKRRLSMNIWTS